MKSAMKNYPMRLWKRLTGKIDPDYVLKEDVKGILKTGYKTGPIKTIFDIGAHKGRWSLEMLDFMPDAKFILFEANPLHKSDLENTGLPHFISVLTKPGCSTVEFFSLTDDKGSTGGSMYKEKTAPYKAVHPRALPAATLAEFCSEANLPQPDLIKIDTQGSELDVMEGGRAIFSASKYILIEMQLFQCNEGAPSFDQYLTKLRELGFLPIALAEVHHFGPVIHQVDFLFAARTLLDLNKVQELGL